MECFMSKKSFGGSINFYKHASTSCNCEMRFSCFLPEEASENNRLPVLYWLSGLECTEENFMIKSGVQKYAAQHKIIVVAPDTSPPKCGIEGESDNFYFGIGAGFYVNATTENWNKHYKMYDYVSQELPTLIKNNFPASDKMSITGHSMGGHGAMMVALRNPKNYVSVSAFSPISAPTLAPWGQNALKGYLGDDKNEWEKYDSHCLIQKATDKIPIFIDMGGADPLNERELKLEVLEKTAKECNYPITVKIREGYDHSYYYVATFIEEHIRYHAERFSAEMTRFHQRVDPESSKGRLARNQER